MANAAKQWKSTLDNKDLKLSIDLQQLSNLGIDKVKTQIASVESRHFIILMIFVTVKVMLQYCIFSHHILAMV